MSFAGRAGRIHKEYFANVLLWRKLGFLEQDCIVLCYKMIPGTYYIRRTKAVVMTSFSIIIQKAVYTYFNLLEM